MKLRVKHVINPGTVHRLEVSNTATLRDLLDACIASVPVAAGSTPADVVVSFNKKDGLAGPETASLASLGVCSGDLLWVLAPPLASVTTAAPPPPTRPAGASNTARSASGQQAAMFNMSSNSGRQDTVEAAGGKLQLAAAAAVAVTDARPHAAGAPGTIEQQGGCSAGTSARSTLQTAAAAGTAAHTAATNIIVNTEQPITSGAHAATAAAAAAATATETAGSGDSALNPAQHPPPKPWMPDHLNRLLVQVQVQQEHHQQHHEQQSQQLQVLTRAQCLLLSMHAAMLESGFLPHEQQQKQQVPPLLHGIGNIYGMAYTMPGSNGSYGSRASGTDAPSTNGGSSTSSASSNSSILVEVKGIDMGNFLVLLGSLKSLHPAAISGSAAAAAAKAGVAPPAAAPQKLVATLNVPKTHIAPCSTTNNTANCSNTARDAIRTVAAATAQGAARSDSTQQEQGAQQQQRCAGWPLCCYTSLHDLWVMLKDKLCLPLLLAACAAAGLPPPAGLSSLPYELQELVLVNLEAKALAALSCTCTPLRHRASTNALWKPLFDHEFPQHSIAAGGGGSGGGSSGGSSGTAGRIQGSRMPQSYALQQALNHIRQEAGRRGWKWAYGAAWVQRARIIEDERRRFMVSSHCEPYPVPMPWGPFRPHHPIMPPNIIGGDYDRFPVGLGFSGAGHPRIGGALPGGAVFGGGGSITGGLIGQGTGGALFSGAVQGVGSFGGMGGSGGLGGHGGGLGLGAPGLGGRRREGGSGSSTRLF